MLEATMNGLKSSRWWGVTPQLMGKSVRVTVPTSGGLYGVSDVIGSAIAALEHERGGHRWACRGASPVPTPLRRRPPNYEGDPKNGLRASQHPNTIKKCFVKCTVLQAHVPSPATTPSSRP
jgi:hypothetical protein